MIQAIQGARALIFDFDGTLVDSNAIKREAFRRCFEEFPDRLEEILAYCYAHNHVPRWEKFRHAYEQILKIPYTREAEIRLLRRFEQETTEAIIAAPPLPGAEPFLRQTAVTHPLGILSSTPQEILRQILERRGWAPLFRWIQGAPVNKTEWLTRLQAEEGLTGGHLLFFGDTPEDAQSARESGCSFVLISDRGNFAELLR